MEVIGLLFEMMASFISWVPVVVLHWLLLRKASLPGWAAIVPFYGQYMYAKMLKKIGYFWAQIICGVVSFLAFIGMVACVFVGDSAAEVMAIILTIVLFVASIAILVINIMMDVQLAKVFGQSGWFAVGLVFLTLIFKLILVVDNSIQYVGDGYKDPQSTYNPNYNPTYNPTNPQFNADPYNNGYVQPNVPNNVQPDGYQNPGYQTMDDEDTSNTYQNDVYQMPTDDQDSNN